MSVQVTEDAEAKALQFLKAKEAQKTAVADPEKTPEELAAEKFLQSKKSKDAEEESGSGKTPEELAAEKFLSSKKSKEGDDSAEAKAAAFLAKKKKEKEKEEGKEGGGTTAEDAAAAFLAKKAASKSSGDIPKLPKNCDNCGAKLKKAVCKKCGHKHV
jgi:hypothetical protein